MTSMSNLQPTEGTSEPIPLPDVMPTDMRGALRLCGERFRAYEASHQERGHLIKAVANGAMADMCEYVLFQPASAPAPVNIDMLADKIEGLKADLDAAVEVAFKRGATDWVRLNYPDQFNRLTSFQAMQPSEAMQSRYHLLDPTVTIHTADGWKTFGEGWMLISEAEYELLTLDVLKPGEYGWAPGNYMARCCDCGFVSSDVDKRAVRCKRCAEDCKKVYAAQVRAARPAEA